MMLYTIYDLISGKIFSVFPESDLPAGVLRLVVQCESLAGVITLIRIVVLARVYYN